MTEQIPGWEGSIGPFPSQYSQPHVYARDVHSGAGNCVCGAALHDARHVQAAPGVPIPGRQHRAPTLDPLPPPGTYQLLRCMACGQEFVDVLANAAPTGCPGCGAQTWRVDAPTPMARPPIVGWVNPTAGATAPAAPITVHSFRTGGET